MDEVGSVVGARRGQRPREVPLTVIVIVGIAVLVAIVVLIHLFLTPVAYSN